MQFTPKAESELSKGGDFGPLEEGEYPFTVLESDEVLSKSAKNPGKPMAKLKLAVHRPDGGEQWVWDYFADWFSEWKLKHFLDSIGCEQHYTQGIADFSNNHYQGRAGYVLIGIDKDGKTGKDRNVAVDYVVKQAAPKASVAGFAAIKAAVADAPESDDVPF